ncbi:MAG: class I SAM-dependent methyltransferase [Candidatus Nomurabacteria bacterium]|jgi:ubiquinone/menaquinone biosynthesis C-methylase UbiE|nr:class I SAM-dependent methyltransferase [Candidatus Nomurabacteria bacterium]
MKYDSTLFATAAKYYAVSRPVYPEAIIERMVEVFQLSKRDTVLDLGCGTGEIALRLAKYVKKVLAWDPDVEMLKLAEQKARKHHVKNVIFEQKSSDDLPSLSEKVKVVAMGRSFHWMDGEKTLAEIKKRLAGEGGVAIVYERHGLHVYSSAFVEPNATTARRNQTVSRVAKKYLGEERKAGKNKFRKVEKSFQEMLNKTGFLEIIEEEITEQYRRSIENTIGFVFSTSWGSPQLFGGKVEAFKKELSEELSKINPDGTFDEKIIFGLLAGKL